MERKTKLKMTNQNVHKHRHLGNDWQAISNTILGFLESHSHSYAEQVECQISATKSEASELLGKAIELGGEG